MTTAWSPYFVAKNKPNHWKWPIPCDSKALSKLPFTYIISSFGASFFLLQFHSYNTLEKSIHPSLGLSKAQIRLNWGGVFGFVLCVFLRWRDREGHSAGAGVHCLLELPYERWWLNPLVLKGFSSNESKNMQCIDEKRALTVEMFSTEIMLFRALWDVPQVNLPSEINRIDFVYAGHFSCGCIVVANWQVKICTWSLVENTLKVYI